MLLWGPQVGRLKQSGKTGVSLRRYPMTVLAFVLVEAESSAKNRCKGLNSYKDIRSDTGIVTLG